jgi:hypothetical protein
MLGLRSVGLAELAIRDVAQPVVGQLSEHVELDDFLIECLRARGVPEVAVRGSTPQGTAQGPWEVPAEWPDSLSFVRREL